MSSQPATAKRSDVIYHVPARGVPRRPLLQFARAVQQDVAKGRAFTCLISSDEALRELNRKFRKKNEATDVLSFPSADLGGAAAGEIAISFHRAQDQSAAFGHSTPDEIRILLLHGVLHLLGLDHERDRGEMARAERRWRKHYGLPVGLIERVPA